MVLGARAPVLRGLRVATPGDDEVHHRHPPLLPFVSRSEFDPSAFARFLARRAARRPLASPVLGRSPMGSCCPSTLATESSDLHRACLARLCCAFRLSQPLDALFRFRSLRPCFMPVTPLGFHLQRLPLAVSRPHLSVRPFPPAVSPSIGRSRPRLQGFELQASPFTSNRCYPGPNGRSSLGVFPSEVFPPRSGPTLRRVLLSWASARHRTANRPALCLLCRVSKNRGVRRSLAGPDSLPEVFRPRRLAACRTPSGSTL